MDLVISYILGMILLAVVVITFYIFDRSKVAKHIKYLVYGIIGLPFIAFFLYLNWLLWIDEGSFTWWYWVGGIFGIGICFAGIYYGITTIKENKKDTK